MEHRDLPEAARQCGERSLQIGPPLHVGHLGRSLETRAQAPPCSRLRRGSADRSPCHQEMSHGVPCDLIMLTKQVSRPVDGLLPVVAPEAGQVERNSKKDLVTGPIRGFCALQAEI